MLKMRKLHKKTLLMAILAALAGPAYASVVNLPTGGTFEYGSAGSITTSGDTENINVSTLSGSNGYANVLDTGNDVVIDWSGGFDVGAGYTVNFSGLKTATPSNDSQYSSAYINVDDSGNPSAIAGTITANNNVPVFVINPDGVTVAGTANLAAMPVGLIAGSLDSNGNMDLTTSPITVSSGVTVDTTTTDADASIYAGGSSDGLINAESGSTLPIEIGGAGNTGGSTDTNFIYDITVPDGTDNYNVDGSGSYYFNAESAGSTIVNIAGNSVAVEGGGLSFLNTNAANPVSLNVSLDGATVDGGFSVNNLGDGNSSVSLDNVTADNMIIFTGGDSANDDAEPSNGSVSLSGNLTATAGDIEIKQGDLKGYSTYPVDIANGADLSSAGVIVIDADGLSIGSAITVSGTELIMDDYASAATSEDPSSQTYPNTPVNFDADGATITGENGIGIEMFTGGLSDLTFAGDIGDLSLTDEASGATQISDVNTSSAVGGLAVKFDPYNGSSTSDSAELSDSDLSTDSSNAATRGFFRRR